MKFRASVQYNDWRGTSAADDADTKSVAALLRERGLMGDHEFIIGIEAWIGENFGGKAEPASVHALVVEGAGVTAAEEQLMASDGPIKVRQIDLNLSVEEFVGLFKRFSVAFSRGGMLTDAEYEAGE